MTKRHRNKNGWKIEQFWKIWKKKDQISALFSTQTPPDDWPDAIAHLTIGLVANKCTKLRKTSQIWYLVLGCPTWKSHCAKRETEQPWNSKSVFTLSVANQREIRRKKLKRQQHFVTTWFFFTFPIWSFVMEYFGVMIHNQPNQTKPNNQQHFVMMMCKYCYILSTTNLKWVWHLIIQIKKSKKSILHYFLHVHMILIEFLFNHLKWRVIIR